MTRTVGLIPSRLGSTRLNNKALLPIDGLPIIVHTMKRAQLAQTLEDVFVCTDSEEIAKVVEENGGRVIMTKPTHLNGTERIAEAKTKLEDQGLYFDFYVDIQGDEPLINPKSIDAVCQCHSIDNLFIATECQIMLPTLPIEDPSSQHVVKVIKSVDGRVLYLTRAVAPFQFRSSTKYHKHLSIISFTSEGLERYASKSSSPLEEVEGIELLRAIEHGITMRTVELEGDSFSVDVEADYQRAVQAMKSDKWVKKYAKA